MRRLARSISFLLSIIILFYSVPAVCENTDLLVSEKLVQGNEFLEQGNLEKAIMCFDIADKLIPNHFETAICMTQAYHGAGNLERALDYANRAVDIMPASGDAYMARYSLLMESERYSDAWIDLQYAALCGTAIDEETFANVAVGLVEVFQYDEAVDAFTCAGNSAFQSDAANAYRLALIHSGKRSEAESLGLIIKAWHDEPLNAAFMQGLEFRIDEENVDYWECDVFVSKQYLLEQEENGITPEIDKVSLNDRDGLISLGLLSTIVPNKVDQNEYFFEPLDISPDGSTILLTQQESALFAYRNEKLICLMPVTNRGAADVYGTFAMFNSLRPSTRVGVEGVAWSPDGRYAAFAIGTDALMKMKCYDLVIADIEKGEYFLAVSTPKRAREGASVAVNACFDETGRYVYFTSYETQEANRVSLNRYDIATGE